MTIEGPTYMQTNRANHLVKGALFLTVAGILSKLLSAAYRIPLQNLTGDFGLYIYQQVYPILGMTLILSLYGFPSAIAKLTVVDKEKQTKLSFSHVVLPLFLILFLMSSLMAFIIWKYAHNFAQLIGDEQLTSVFKKLALVFLIIPFTALLRGIFQSQLHMQPIAYSQVSEQIVRVLIILTAAILYSTGRLSSIYKIGEWAVYAALFAGIVAIIVLLLCLKKNNPLVIGSLPIPWKKYIYTMVVLGIVASLNHMILLFIQFADTLTLVRALQSFGLTRDEAMLAKGVFDRGQPLIQLGTVIGSSFALTLIPEVAKKENVSMQSLTETMTFSFYLAVGATAGLLLIFPETNLLLFKDLKGTFSLQILSLAVILSTMSVTAIAILQGIGVIIRTALYIIVAFSIKGLSNLFLVPILNITGSALATIFSLLCLTILVFYELQKRFTLLVIWKELRWGPLVKAVVAMIVYIIGLKLVVSNILIQSRLLLLGYVIFVVITGSVLYLLVLARNNALTDEQLAALPLSHLLKKFNE